MIELVGYAGTSDATRIYPLSSSLPPGREIRDDEICFFLCKIMSAVLLCPANIRSASPRQGDMAFSQMQKTRLSPFCTSSGRVTPVDSTIHHGRLIASIRVHYWA